MVDLYFGCPKKITDITIICVECLKPPEGWSHRRERRAENGKREGPGSVSFLWTCCLRVVRVRECLLCAGRSRAGIDSDKTLQEVGGPKNPCWRARARSSEQTRTIFRLNACTYFRETLNSEGRGTMCRTLQQLACLPCGLEVLRSWIASRIGKLGVRVMGRGMSWAGRVGDRAGSLRQWRRRTRQMGLRILSNSL